MERLLEILREIQPDADYDTCTTLVTDNYLDSLAILSLVAELEEEFDIDELTEEDTASIKTVGDLVRFLQNKID